MQHEMKQVYGQPGSMEYILRSQLAKSVDGTVKMSPGTAKRILEELNFPGQRKIDSRRVYGHSHAIVKGDWMESYPIHFAALPDGRIWLVDGQHRLTAIGDAMAPVGVTIRIVEMESEKEARNFYSGFDGKGSVRTNVQIQDFGIRDIGAGSVRQRVQQSALAWNAYFEGRDLKIIKCVTGAAITLSGTPLNGKTIK